MKFYPKKMQTIGLKYTILKLTKWNYYMGRAMEIRAAPDQISHTVDE